MTVLALSTLLLAGPIQAAPQPPPELPAFVDVPLLVTTYWPPAGGINCAGDCTRFGSGQRIQAHHVNTTAACPTAWRGRMVVIEGFGSWWCADSGGGVVVHWTREHGLHAHIDVLRPDAIEQGPFYRWRLVEGEEARTQ